MHLILQKALEQLNRYILFKIIYLFLVILDFYIKNLEQEPWW